MRSTKKNLLLLLICALFFISAGSAVAQGIPSWSPPTHIPAYTDDRPPIMLADSAGTVHAFNSIDLDPTRNVIYYRKWTPEGGWTMPVDIFIRPKEIIRPLQSVFLDHSGIFHLIFYVGTEDQGSVYYSTAWAGNADGAWSWTKPREVASGAGPLTSAVITGDGEDKLVIIYSGQKPSLGLYEVHSTDGGKTWSTPVAVETTYSPTKWASTIWTTYDTLGNLHAVWGIVNQNGVGEAIRYSHLGPDLAHWTEPIDLTTQSSKEVSTGAPSIIADGNELIAIYQDSQPPTKWMRRSEDGGKTWSAPVRPFSQIGGYESAFLVKDSNNIIHMLVGDRIPLPEIHGMWHSEYINNEWTDLQPIISGPVTNTFDPSAPQAVISRGNNLLVAWWNNVRDAGPADYSFTKLNAPELPSVPLPTLNPSPTPTSYPTETVPLSTPSVAPQPIGGTDPGGPANRSPVIAIILGIIPAVLLIGVILFIKRPNQGSR